MSQVWHFLCQMFSFSEQIHPSQNQSPNLIGPWWSEVSVIYVKYLRYSQSLDWTMRKVKLLFYISVSPLPRLTSTMP